VLLEENQMQIPPFISLEGIDGSGKSTQCPLLADWLRRRGFRVTQCVDPGGTPIGDDLRRLLLGHQHEMSLLCELFLFMASRAELVSKVIRPALAENSIVVTDRYLLSNVVYQGHAGGLDPEELWHLGYFATGGLEPDLTIVLDLPVTQAVSRRKKGPDRVESRATSYHEAVREGFLTEARRRPERIRIVDGSPPIEAVQARIQQEVVRVVESHQRA
jgi:dTMP kinase